MTMPDLTAAERDVLRGIYERKTAKEIGVELGISHHAVEKRLKRARAKLGVATSLEASRLFAERYDLAVSGDPDLKTSVGTDQQQISGGRVRRTAILPGVIIMLSIAIAGVFFFQADPQADAFARIDADGSGTIEKNEFLALADRADSVRVHRVKNGDVERAEGDAARDAMEMVFDRIDKNGDGKLTPTEVDEGNMVLSTTDVELSDNNS